MVTLRQVELLWGVPSFRVLNQQGEETLSVWGQDRLWLVAQDIKR